MPDELTIGERLVGRKLQTEKRAGVPHYVTGQHEAVVFVGLRDATTNAEIEIARLSYVDIGGHAVVVILMREKGESEWEATWLRRAGHAYEGHATMAPASFALSEKMRAALDAAGEPRPIDTPEDAWALTSIRDEV